jgi:flagellar biosynthesis chaperone FliJ
MKGLETLIKLQKTHVDEQRLMLAKLHEQLQRIEDKMAALHTQQEKQKELLHKNPDMGLTYGNYLENSLKRMELLEKEKSTMKYAIELALDKLAALFEEQKRYEIAQKQREEEAIRQEAARETKVLDEVGSVGFVRKGR